MYPLSFHLAILDFVAAGGSVFLKHILFLLCRLRSIATHRYHFVCRLSVRLSHFSVTLSKDMFCRRHMHSSECCPYLCRLRSIATHRDYLAIVCLSVRLSHFSVTLSKAYVSQATHAFLKGMFRRRHMHSLECCHYFF